MSDIINSVKKSIPKEIADLKYNAYIENYPGMHVFKRLIDLIDER